MHIQTYPFTVTFLGYSSVSLPEDLSFSLGFFLHQSSCLSPSPPSLILDVYQNFRLIGAEKVRSILSGGRSWSDGGAKACRRRTRLLLNQRATRLVLSVSFLSLFSEGGGRGAGQSSGRTGKGDE